MDILTSFIVVIGLIFSVVIYQSRRDKPNIRLYLWRFKKLVMIFINYFRDIGFYASDRFKEINWNLAEMNDSVNQIDSVDQL